jgi:hypothetical protein
MVRITQGSENGVTRISDPADASLRNVFNHFAVKSGNGFKPHVIQRQVETNPGEPGVLLQYL